MREQCRLLPSLNFLNSGNPYRTFSSPSGAKASSSGAAGTAPANQVENPTGPVSVWKECWSSLGTTMKISKLLSTGGYDEGLWDLSFSWRKSSVFTEEMPGGPMKVGRSQVFFNGASKPVQAHSIYVFQNEFPWQLECLVPAGPIDFIHYPQP